MSLFGSIAGIFSGNAAANALKDSQRQNRRLANETYDTQTGAIAPYMQTGQSGLDAINALISGGPDAIGASGEAILSKALGDVSGRYASMGLSDSGAGRNALLQEALRQRLGIRGQMFNEGMGVAGLGQNALQQFLGAGNTRLGAVTGANTNIGEARAGNALNFGNQIGGIADQGLDAILKAATGGGSFGAGLMKQAGGFA